MNALSARWSSAIALTVLLGCRGTTWQAGPALLAPPRRVAEALGDPLPVEELAVSAIPVLDAPRRTRPCCVFGMDLHTNLAGVPVPLVELGNIVAIPLLGRHEYDNGALSLAANDRLIETENNGLIYTCRGGFIDTAHIRDNADLTLFLALRFARDLEHGIAFEMPGDGSGRRITLDPVPAPVLASRGRIAVALALATWTAWQLDLFHELSTWWGWHSTAGFSEKTSAFSLEDLYSDAVGIRMGAGVVRELGFHTRDDYNRVMDAWIPETLRRLGAQPQDVSRAAMHALDTVWWDSTKRIPDFHIVLRRAFPTGETATPWRAPDAFETYPQALRGHCVETAPALAITITERVEGVDPTRLIHIEWRPEEWAGATFPFADPRERKVTLVDLPAVIEATRVDMQRALGEGFDRPRGPITPPVAPQ